MKEIDNNRLLLSTPSFLMSGKQQVNYLIWEVSQKLDVNDMKKQHPVIQFLCKNAVNNYLLSLIGLPFIMLY